MAQAYARVLAGSEASHAHPREERAIALADHPRGHAARMGDIRRTGTLTLAELALLGGSELGSKMGTTRNFHYVNSEIEIDEAFWRVVGLYLAEGHCSGDYPYARNVVRGGLSWSFHPEREQHLVDEVVAYWKRQGIDAKSWRTPTS